MRRAISLVALAAFAPASVLSVSSSRVARADVGVLCRSSPTPASDAQALRQAPFAFDGVAISGRVLGNKDGGVVLISPLIFRVTRWLKRGSARVVPAPAGDEVVHLWDGRYAHLADGVLRSYSRDLTTRFHGEIKVFPAQAWRIFGTNESGVNFTCTNLLGSHPLRGPESASPSIPPSPRSRSQGPSASSRLGTRWSLVGGLALLLAVGLAAWLLAKRRRTGRVH